MTNDVKGRQMHETQTITYAYDFNLTMEEGLERMKESHAYFKQDLPSDLSRGAPTKVKDSMILSHRILPCLFSTNETGTVQSVSMYGPPKVNGIPPTFLRSFVRTRNGNTFIDVFFNCEQVKRTRFTSLKTFKILSSIFEYHLIQQLKTIQLGSNLEFTPCIPKEGFLLSLYKYQKLSLQWMKMVEHPSNSAYRDVTNLQSSHMCSFDSLPNALVDFLTQTFVTHSSKFYEAVDYTCAGGVLSDKPGYGTRVFM